MKNSGPLKVSALERVSVKGDFTLYGCTLKKKLSFCFGQSGKIY